MNETISTEEARKQVVLMARRTAMLYQAFAETLEEELGRERAEEIILRVIELFGRRCGQRVREGVRERGLELTISNFSAVPDLPELGWDLEPEVVEEDRELRVDVRYCPLAEQWLKDMDPALARLYCYVDQAKFSAYNPDITCTHTCNLLDGDDRCTLLIQKHEGEDGEDEA